MGLFDLIADIVTLPISVAQDIIEAPGKIIDGDLPLPHATALNVAEIAKDILE